MYIAKNVRVISFWLLSCFSHFCLFSHFNKEAVFCFAHNACVCVSVLVFVRVRNSLNEANARGRECPSRSLLLPLFESGEFRERLATLLLS